MKSKLKGYIGTVNLLKAEFDKIKPNPYKYKRI